jgi:acyl dehydratase
MRSLAMSLNTSIVGAPLDTQTVRVTTRMALAFAAAIDDNSDFTFDDADQACFVAPPFLCVSLEWLLVGASRQGLLGLTADEARRAVHAGQDTAFHRLLRPGATVTVSGRIVEARRTSAGALVKTLIETSDADTGQLYARTVSASIFRGIPVEGHDRSIDVGFPPNEPVESSAGVMETRIDLDRWFPHRYTECAAIWNPIHTERRVALAAGLPDIIVHGTALWALAGREIVSAYGDRNPARLRRLCGRFSAMVIPGTAIIVRHGPSASKDGHIAYSVLNAAGETAVSGGYAVIAKDG